MIYLGIGRDEPALSVDERRWRRETRSAWLRLGVFGILVINLLLGEHGGNLLLHANVVIGYGLATALALSFAFVRQGQVGCLAPSQSWMRWRSWHCSMSTCSQRETCSVMRSRLRIWR